MPPGMEPLQTPECLYRLLCMSFYHRPIVAVCIALMFVFGGLTSALSLSFSLYPDIIPPGVGISIQPRGGWRTGAAGDVRRNKQGGRNTGVLRPVAAPGGCRTCATTAISCRNAQVHMFT